MRKLQRSLPTTRLIATSSSSGRHGRSRLACPRNSKQRRHFDTLVGDLSLKFINLPANEIDPEIEDSQRRVCQCLGLDMCSLWQWSDESPGFLALTHLYRSVEGPPNPPAGRMPRSIFPGASKDYWPAKSLRFHPSRICPAEAARDREEWRHFGIKSALVIPLSAGGGPLIGGIVLQ